MRFGQPPEGPRCWAFRLGRAGVAVAVPGDEGGQENPGEPDAEQPEHDVLLDQVGPLGLVGGLADGVEELVELLVGLEEGLLLAHDHGGSLRRANICVE